jgi:hypothetical protein
VSGNLAHWPASMAAKEEREKPKQVKDEDDHRSGIVVGSELIDQLLKGRVEFWRGTGQPGWSTKMLARSVPGRLLHSGAKAFRVAAVSPGRITWAAESEAMCGSL